MDSSYSLMNPALVSVVGVVDSQGVSEEKKKKVAAFDRNTKVPASILTKSSSDKPLVISRSAKSSVDAKVDALDQKWLERFNRLEALLLARSLEKPQQVPTFQTVNVTPPVGSVKVTDPFID